MDEGIHERIRIRIHRLESWKQRSSNDLPACERRSVILQETCSDAGAYAESFQSRLENASGTDSPKRPWMPLDLPFLPTQEQIDPSILYIS